MHDVMHAEEKAMPHTQPRSIQTVARACGILVLVSLIAGGFGEGYVPSRIIVPADPAATADRLRTLSTMFRLGFASYLIEASCDIALALGFFVLLEPVSRRLALLSAFFGLVGTAIYAVAEVFCLGAASLASGASWLQGFASGQSDTLAFMWLKLYQYGAVVSLLFYGLATVLRGYLMVRSTFLPAWVGVLMLLGGLAFAARTFAFVLAPAFPSASLTLMMAPAGLALIIVLLSRGVDVARWQAMSAPAGSPDRASRR